ncbi:MAG: nicotinamidase, partial [Myxococcota bacterium]
MLPLPAHYEPETTRDWGHTPDHRVVLSQAIEWQIEHKIRPAAQDERKVHLLLIDVQRDFCFPEGTLYVGGRSGTGALEDNKRITELIYRQLDEISAITTTHDTHLAFQIFTPPFWVDRHGAHPNEHSTVSTQQILAGDLKPNPAMASWLCGGDLEWLEGYVTHYTRQLEAAGKYTLYLWPPHCILGSDGHVLAGAIHKARMFHAYARGAQSHSELKGDHALTENYSAFAPEVTTLPDGTPFAERNAELLKTLMGADQLIVAGQAASHCVKWSVDDLV